MESRPDYKPFVPQHVEMREFTIGTVVLGLVMTVVLGAANAYLGLKAGQTIAATYPAAVISMAVLRLRRGTILQENLARTAGSIGESVAAGAVFTLPAFVIAGAWPSFEGPGAYLRSTTLMIVGSVLGVLFVSLVRRAMVEDKSLPFPESTAAAEIHKAGQRGGGAAKFLFMNMITGGVIILGSALNFFAFSKDFLVHIGQIGVSKVRLGEYGYAARNATGADIDIGLLRFGRSDGTEAQRVVNISDPYFEFVYNNTADAATREVVGMRLCERLRLVALLQALAGVLTDGLQQGKARINRA